MGVSSGRSRVADIAFQVFGRAVHPDWYAARAFRRVSLAAWTADVRIVEGGHAVAWASGSTRLTEILSGPETPLPELGLLFHSHIRQERSVTLAAGSRVEYQSCFEAERVEPEVFAHLSEEMTLDGARGGLFHGFARASRMAPPAAEPPAPRIEGAGAVGPRHPHLPGRARDRADSIAVRGPSLSGVRPPSQTDRGAMRPPV